MPSTRTVITLLAGLALLAHPVVGNGPGPETRYTYEPTTVDRSDDEAVEVLYELPEVSYGVGTQIDAVREAVNSTYRRPASAVSERVRALTDVQYLADDAGDQYYRVQAAVADDTFELDATPVSPGVVATALAVEPGAAPEAIRDALDERHTAATKENATLVVQENGYTLVRVVETETVPDPLAIPKLIGYALGVVLVTFGLVTGRE